MIAANLRLITHPRCASYAVSQQATGRVTFFDADGRRAGQVRLDRDRFPLHLLSDGRIAFLQGGALVIVDSAGQEERRPANTTASRLIAVSDDGRRWVAIGEEDLMFGSDQATGDRLPPMLGWPIFSDDGSDLFFIGEDLALHQLDVSSGLSKVIAHQPSDLRTVSRLALRGRRLAVGVRSDVRVEIDLDAPTAEWRRFDDGGLEDVRECDGATLIRMSPTKLDLVSIDGSVVGRIARKREILEARFVGRDRVAIVIGHPAELVQRIETVRV